VFEAKKKNVKDMIRELDRETVFQVFPTDMMIDIWG
jgi:hypothetical protein